MYLVGFYAFVCGSDRAATFHRIINIKSITESEDNGTNMIILTCDFDDVVSARKKTDFDYVLSARKKKTDFDDVVISRKNSH